jgi:polysaccharide biosynthesis/export protein
MMMARFIFILTLVTLAGCASTAPTASLGDAALQEPEADPRNARLAEIAAASASASGSASADAEGHRIGADDLLEISVFNAPEMSGSARVSSQGEIFLPLIDPLAAAGHSPESLAREVEARLRGRFMVDPQVTVQVLEIHSRPVSVLGSVRQPGLLHLRGSRPLAEVIAMAGGFAPEAGETVRIRRAAARDGEPAAVEVGVSELLEASAGGNRIMYVHPGDAVSVERAGIVYVVGEVGRPGAFPLRGGAQLTALQAIALGGGMKRTASRRRVLVVRTEATGERTTIPVDIARASSGNAPDLKLQSDDVVYVPNSAGRMISLGALDMMVRIVTFRPVF